MPWDGAIPTSEGKHHEQEEQKAILGPIREAGGDDTLVLCSEPWLVDDERGPVDRKEICFYQNVAYLRIRQVKTQ